MSMEYNVIFHIEGCGFKGKMYEADLKREFVDMYNNFCDIVNPQLETWNKEYDASDQVLTYEGFIYEKYLPIAKNLRSYWLKGDVDKEDVIFIARMKGLPESKIYITLEER